MTRHCVANPVPVVRCSGRVQNGFFYPSPPPKKFRFNRPTLSKVLKIMMIKMMMIIMITTTTTTTMMMIIIIIIII